MTVTVFQHNKSNLLIIPTNKIVEETKKGIKEIKQYKGNVYVPKTCKKFFLELLKVKCEDAQGELFLITKF